MKQRTQSAGGLCLPPAHSTVLVTGQEERPLIIPNHSPWCEFCSRVSEGLCDEMGTGTERRETGKYVAIRGKHILRETTAGTKAQLERKAH